MGRFVLNSGGSSRRRLAVLLPVSLVLHGLLAVAAVGLVSPEPLEMEERIAVSLEMGRMDQRSSPAAPASEPSVKPTPPAPATDARPIPGKAKRRPPRSVFPRAKEKTVDQVVKEFIATVKTAQWSVETPTEAVAPNEGVKFTDLKTPGWLESWEPSNTPAAMQNDVDLLSTVSDKVREAVLLPSGFSTTGDREPLEGRRQKVFTDYFDAVHERQIHPRFAEGYLNSLDDRPLEDPLNDGQLRTFLEVEVARNGSISDVRVAQPSGNVDFDAAAVNAVYEAGPFPETPRDIRSWNGNVYVQWGFYRNHRRCGVFNAEPYRLTRPKNSRVVRYSGEPPIPSDPEPVNEIH